MAGKLQDADFSTSAELISRGSSASQLLNDTKVYVTANTLNKSLYQAITDGDLAGGGGVTEFIDFRYRVASGSDGGTATSGSWITYPINLVSGVTSLGSLSSNQMTISTGTWRLKGLATFAAVNRAQIKLYNITDTTDQSEINATALISIPAFSAASVGDNVLASISGTFTIAASKTFEIRYQVGTTRASFGLGTGANFGFTNDFGWFELEKLS